MIAVERPHNKRKPSAEERHNKMREFGPHIQVVGCSGEFYKKFSLQNRFSDHCDHAVQLHLIRVNVNGEAWLFGA